jgi:S1-C subfamily serine protease
MTSEPLDVPDFEIHIEPGIDRISFGTPDEGVIAGAQLLRVGELKDYFGVNDGLLVLRVVPGTPAERAGLRPGDVLVRIHGEAVTGIDDVSRILDGRLIGQRITVTLLRGEELLEVFLIAEERLLPA